jgi:uncharacterized membrane protein YkvA (DUF1232 family)
MFGHHAQSTPWSPLLNRFRNRMQDWARAIRRDTHALARAARDPRVPWYAKALALCVAAYALSPIDLIPDVIPVIGLLDEIVLLPLAMMLVIRLIPPAVMAEHRAAAEAAPPSRTAAVVIVLIWIAALALFAWLVWRMIS